jgi:uncharacterized protein involved in exopolysaccharide biosynthesis
MRKFRVSVWILFGILLGVAVGAATSFLLPTQYEATVELQVVPGRFPELFAGSAPALPIQQRLKDLKTRLLARSQLVSVIQANNLYPQERGRLPLEDVFRIMRNDVRLWTQSECASTTVYLSFRYKDGALAKKVAGDLAERLLYHYRSSQLEYQRLMVDALRHMLDTASRQWLALKQSKVAAAEHPELRALDIGVAQRRYESARQKLNEAEDQNDLSNRQLGEGLYWADSPSQPEKPVSPRRQTFIASGALGGLLVSLVVVFVKKPGSRKPPDPETNS